MTWLIACECSGAVRDAMLARGVEAVSCDIKPTERPGPHIQGDVLRQLDRDWSGIVASPDCTYLTYSAEWAYGPGPYHMKLKPGTLTGQARLDARKQAITFARALWGAHERVILENPIGVLSDYLGKPQIVQPYMFGDDASKQPASGSRACRRCGSRARRDGFRPGWSTAGRAGATRQTDSGQNRLSPGPNRAADRARTWPGIANALADHISGGPFA